jgi:hypothetical protein
LLVTTMVAAVPLAAATIAATIAAMIALFMGLPLPRVRVCVTIVTQFAADLKGCSCG